jgi:hypothetical protein
MSDAKNAFSFICVNPRSSAVKCFYSSHFAACRAVGLAKADRFGVKKTGICSPTDLNALTERLGTWWPFPPVCDQFRRGLH